MYETKQETTGLRSGFRQAKPPQRVECVSASVLYEGQRSCANLQREGARARRQTRTGYRQNFQSNDDEILAGKPLVIRWFVYIFAVLCLCGISQWRRLNGSSGFAIPLAAGGFRLSCSSLRSGSSCI